MTLDLLQNTPLWIGVFAIIFAQFLKVPIYFLATKKVDWSLFTSTGGMPSSHSAAVTSIATAVGLETGFGSPIFAVAAMLAGIVMYDARGVRRETGTQAVVLNQIMDFFGKYEKDDFKIEFDQTKLKELVGHTPFQVVCGAILGIIVGLVSVRLLP